MIGDFWRYISVPINAEDTAIDPICVQFRGVLVAFDPKDDRIVVVTALMTAATKPSAHARSVIP